MFEALFYLPGTRNNGIYVYETRKNGGELIMNIILKNGDVLKTEENATCMQAAQAISEGRGSPQYR